MVAKMQTHYHCEELKSYAKSTLHNLRLTMTLTHGTAEQVVQSGMGGYNEWHPIRLGVKNPISYSEFNTILNWAVQAPMTMTPDEFGQYAYSRCLEP